tara:strand:+ start:10308 stop:10490 length:183 start_codon:yes stop_codon:yes gene_type:complete
VADVDHEHHEALFLEVADDAIVADAVPPEVFETFPLKCFAELPRIIQRLHARVQKISDTR